MLGSFLLGYQLLASKRDAAYEPGGREFESLRARQKFAVTPNTYLSGFPPKPGGCGSFIGTLPADGIGRSTRWVVRYVPEFEKRWNRYARRITSSARPTVLFKKPKKDFDERRTGVWAKGLAPVRRVTGGLTCSIRWPGRNSMGTSLVGNFSVNDGSQVWVVSRHMPHLCEYQIRVAERWCVLDSTKPERSFFCGAGGARIADLGRWAGAGR
jgi:hypothetical protein